MQLAFDLPALARDFYHGSVDPYPNAVTSRYLSMSFKGWGYAYEEWPQELKDEYVYNPTRAKQLLTEAGFPHGI